MKAICRAIVATLIVAVAVGTQAKELRRGEKFLWSGYMVCFPVNADFHRYKDRPLDRPPSDAIDPRRVDVRGAVSAGIDAFSVDLFIADKFGLGAFGQLVKIVHDDRSPLMLSPMFDGFQQPGVTSDAIVAKVRAWFERFAREPCIVRFEGKPVIFTFAAYELSPRQWREIFDRLHAAGCDGYWVGELGKLLRGPTADLRPAQPWLDLFAAANVFHIYDAEHFPDIGSAYRASYPSGSHQWVGDVNVGYWRPEIAVYRSHRGTQQFRDTWRLVNSSGAAWVQQSTWNDFSENHHMMPSENYSTTFAELNCYLAAQWKALPAALDRPRLYLSQQQEVLTGEEAEFELLALLEPQHVPASLELRITDGAGHGVKTFAPVTLSSAGLQAGNFRLSVADLPAGRLLFPEGRLCDRAGRPVQVVHGRYTTVTPGGYCPERNYSWLHAPADRQIPRATCVFTLDGRSSGSLPQAGTTGAVSITVDAPVALAEVEVLHDGEQVLSLRREKASLERPLRWSGRIGLNRQGRLDRGAYAMAAVTVDGRMTITRPVFVERPAAAESTLGLWTFDDDRGFDVLDSSPWLHDGRLGGRQRHDAWCPQRVPDRWGGKCLRFDGVGDRVLLEGPIVPPSRFTVECWIRPAAGRGAVSAGQILFATANAAVVLAIEPNGALSLSRHSGDRWYKLADREPLADDVWQHVAATCDGQRVRLYRDGLLVGEKPIAGVGQCGQIGVGFNPVTQGAFYRGDLDELRLSAVPLSPAQFGPHNPLPRSARAGTH